MFIHQIGIGFVLKKLGINCNLIQNLKNRNLPGICLVLRVRHRISMEIFNFGSHIFNVVSVSSENQAHSCRVTFL